MMQCFYCMNDIGPQYKNEIFNINFKTFCSLSCYEENYKTQQEGLGSKTKANNKTDKNNKKVQKKISKQKKR